MSGVNARYIVDDVEAATFFYTTYLSFELEFHPARGVAILSRNSLELLPTDEIPGRTAETASS